MARIRTIKPEFFRSRSLARCPRDARLTFAGLWTEADDHGRGVADTRILKGAIWPLDDDVTHRHVSAHLDVLVATDHIRLYEVGGERFYEVVNWTEHQAAAYRRGDPKHPAPEGYLEAVSHSGVQESAGSTQTGAGREGNREQGREDPLSTDVDTDDDGFAHFWTVWPRRNGKKLAKDKAHRAWSRLTLPERRDAYRGAVNYAAASKAGIAGAKDAFRWLQGREWPDWQDPAKPSTNGATGADPPRASPPEVGSAEWEARRRESEDWSSAVLGDTP